MFVFQKIAEKRIKEAQERGDFDDLPGHGEPMNIEDDSHIPEDMRLTQNNAIEYDGERLSSHGGKRDLLQKAT
ncbi:MAG: DUF1992 domain-containing protein [Deltaproteobacteria bacterium]|nr:DUF1992 domain-containing protein [Deltaproteobacteria bacterium]